MEASGDGQEQHLTSAVESTAVEYMPVLGSPPSHEPSDDDDLPSQPTPEPALLADLRAKIVKQVEYYFSDENLPYDKFLMKQVSKDKEGFVSISLIASFRKIKKLTKDSSLIVDALKESSHLVVSRDERKVKRMHPLPKMTNKDKTFRCFTVVVENLPDDHSTDNIRKIFGQVGSIQSISIHDPHADEAAVKTNKAEKEILLSGKPLAFIRYETAEAAEKAVATLNDETDWRNGLRVQFEEKWKGCGLGRKAWLGSNSDMIGPNRVHVGENMNLSNDQYHNATDNEDGVHKTKERNARKGRTRSKGGKYHTSNGMGHGTSRVIEPSKPPPGPQMPDGTRGFTMGRGRPPISSTV